MYFPAHLQPINVLQWSPAVFYSFEFQLEELMGQFCPIKSFQMSIVSFSFYVRGTDGGKGQRTGGGGEKVFGTGRGESRRWVQDV